MQEIIDKLIRGDKSVAISFAAAKQKWDELLVDFKWDAPNAVEEMKKIASISQFEFEKIPNNEWLGQEIMVIVGIGQFYSVTEGFTERNLEKAKMLVEGILLSSCSIGLQSFAKEMSEFYSLYEDDDSEEKIE